MKLKRPKTFEVSEHQMSLMVQNVEYPIANLKRSGAILNHIILFGYKDEWHEVEVAKFDLTTSNLEAFKEHSEKYDHVLSHFIPALKQSPIEITVPEPGLKHADFERLEKAFPGYDYHIISKLHRHESRFRKCPYDELKLAMQRISERKITIDQWISESLDSEKTGYIKAEQKGENSILGYFTNENGVIINPDTDYEYLKNGANVRLFTGQFKDGNWGNGLHVSTGIREGMSSPVSEQSKSPTKHRALSSVCSRALYVMRGLMTMGADNLNEPFTEIQNLLNTMTNQENQIEEEFNPATEAPVPEALKEEIASVSEYSEDTESENTEIEQPKRALSITVIGGLQPEKIQEFKDLKKNQEKIVKANPFVQPKDKESLEKARTAAGNLLKASTAIDGKQKGLADVTKKAFNTLKKTVDDFLLSASVITRTPYDKQKLAIDTYVNAEELRIAVEREAELKKVKERTDRLYAIPMTFNGEVYSIGSEYILPSQINHLSDEEFEAAVERAEKIAVIEKAKAGADKSLLEQIEQLKRELALAKGEPVTENSIPVSAAPAPEPVAELEVREVEGMQQYSIPDAPKTEPVSIATPATAPSQYPYGYVPGTELTPASNKSLRDFDTAHASVLAMNPVPAAFIKCREYFRMGAEAKDIEVAIKIKTIMESTVAEGQPNKPAQINALIASTLS